MCQCFSVCFHLVLLSQLLLGRTKNKKAVTFNRQRYCFSPLGCRPSCKIELIAPFQKWPSHTANDIVSTRYPEHHHSPGWGPICQSLCTETFSCHWKCFCKTRPRFLHCHVNEADNLGKGRSSLLLDGKLRLSNDVIKRTNPQTAPEISVQ